METEEFKDSWLTYQHIMDRSGYSRATVLKFLKDGIIKSTKIYGSNLSGPFGFKYLVKEEDYDEWVKTWPESKKCKRGRPRKPKENKKPSDLVRVIRCKDCKWCTEHYDVDGNRPYWICSNWDGGTDADGFCYEAERKEE